MVGIKEYFPRGRISKVQITVHIDQTHVLNIYNS